MVYELFALKENRGTLPSVYVETIDDYGYQVLRRMDRPFQWQF
jgi:hypothetical protein